MNIIYISNSNIPSRTANSIHVMKMCSALSKEHNVTLIGKKGVKATDDIFNYYGVNKFKIKIFNDGNLFKKIHFYLQLIKFLVGRDKETLVIGRHPFGVFISKILGYKIIYESHGPPRTKLHYYVERHFLKSEKTKSFIVISLELKKIYIELFGCDNSKIKILHDAADIPENIYSEIDLHDDYVLSVGYIGHLYPGRGIDIIINAAKRMPEVLFHIVGGERSDIEYWKEKKIDNVIFFGFISPKETEQFRQSVDVLVMPYQDKVSIAGATGMNTSQWMSPMKLFEYMASKKPIIASDLKVLREILNENNSILVDCNDINGWIDALEKLKDPMLRKNLATKAFNDFKSNHTWDIRAKRILT
jgi:glycosyltransferase involved in cell wall biosynthesis